MHDNERTPRDVREVEAEPDTPLLWVIREQVGLTGTKYGCGIEVCGACTVIINGQSWQRYVSPDGVQKSLVQAAHGATYVVNGQADWPEIETFVRSLTS